MKEALDSKENKFLGFIRPFSQGLKCKATTIIKEEQDAHFKQV